MLFHTPTHAAIDALFLIDQRNKDGRTTDATYTWCGSVEGLHPVVCVPAINTLSISPVYHSKGIYGQNINSYNNFHIVFNVFLDYS